MIGPAVPGPGVVRGALAVVSAVPVVAYCWVALARADFPYDLQWMEGGVVGVVDVAASGKSLYSSPTLDFTPWPYPPLYFWAAAATQHVVGAGFLPLRTISIAASVVVLVLVAVIVAGAAGRSRRPWAAGALASGVYAATYKVGGAWADIGRVDSLFLALCLAGIAAAQRARSSRGGLLVGLLLAAAMLTKQNAVLVAVPVIWWLLVRRRTVGISALVTSAALVTGVTVALQKTTDGWYLPVVGGQLIGQGVEWRSVPGFWLADLLLPFAVTVLAVSLLWWGTGRRWPTARVRSLPLLVPAVGGLVLAGWVGRVHSGGFSNVLMPAYAGVAVVLGVLVARVLDLEDRRTVVGLVAVLALQVAVLGYDPRSLVPTDRDRAAVDELVATVRSIDGPVLVLNHPQVAVMAGKPAYAHGGAMTDVLRGGTSSSAARALRADLSRPLSARGVTAVVLDDLRELELLGPQFDRDYRLARSPLLDPLLAADVLTPPTDVASRPSYLYVRRDR